MGGGGAWRRSFNQDSFLSVGFSRGGCGICWVGGVLSSATSSGGFSEMEYGALDWLRRVVVWMGEWWGWRRGSGADVGTAVAAIVVVIERLGVVASGLLRLGLWWRVVGTGVGLLDLARVLECCMWG